MYYLYLTLIMQTFYLNKNKVNWIILNNTSWNMSVAAFEKHMYKIYVQYVHSYIYI